MHYETRSRQEKEGTNPLLKKALYHTWVHNLLFVHVSHTGPDNVSGESTDLGGVGFSTSAKGTYHMSVPLT